MKIRCMNCMKEYDEEKECCPECGFVKGTLPDEIYHLNPEVVLSERYIIGTVIAYGGFGILYRAWDQKLQVMVAIKEYFPANYVNRNPGEKEIFIYTSKKQGEFEAGLEGFLDEARNTAKFSSHPNIVNVYDYFKENGTAYMVMEFMDGITLKQYIKEQGGKIGWEKAVEILTSICDDLQIVHDAGILHRDISPDNIMMCHDGTVKLFDFGAARFSDMEHEVTRTIILKIGFAPPEQYRAKSRQGEWTDVYALGATLYRAVTGELPDESVNRQEALLKEKKDTLLRPKELEADIPDYLDIAICKAMAIQPELRFKNVMQFKAALLNEKRYVAIEKELENRKKRRKFGIGIILAGLTVAAFGCISYYMNRQNETTLRGAAVSIWVPVENDEEAKQQENMLQSMMEEFQFNYPEVQVEITCVPEEEYESQLQQASAAGTGFPTLYESGMLKTEYAERYAELSEVMELINQEDYYCLDHAYTDNGEIRQLPLGMRLPVAYGNILLSDAGKIPEKRNDKTAFLAGESVLWIADSGNYAEVQEHLPGLYTMMPLQVEELTAGFDHIWSVDRQARPLDQLAAKRILYYFLGETAQDVLHLQYDNNLPLNKNEFVTYLEVNQEFEFLKEQLDSGLPIVFLDGEGYQDALDRDYEELISEGRAMKQLKALQNGGEE